jgi:hypothetical protein
VVDGVNTLETHPDLKECFPDHPVLVAVYRVYTITPLCSEIESLLKLKDLHVQVWVMQLDIQNGIL